MNITIEEKKQKALELMKEELKKNEGINCQ